MRFEVVRQIADDADLLKDALRVARSVDEDPHGRATPTPRRRKDIHVAPLSRLFSTGAEVFVRKRSCSQAMYSL
jgi:hypothetical protein